MLILWKCIQGTCLWQKTIKHDKPTSDGRRTGVSSPSSNTYTVAPASPASIALGSIMWCGAIAHTDWRAVACTFSDWASIWCWVYNTSNTIPMPSPLGKTQVFVEDTWNTRTQESGINRGCKTRAGVGVCNHVALSRVSIWILMSRLKGRDPTRNPSV